LLPLVLRSPLSQTGLLQEQFLWQPIARLPGSSLIVHFNFQ
jgi:hypothetical protein